ncbi:hypothetical protein N7505_008175 [Penicillium chrysogenum]|uniref:Uncharacterized protein n=1 Tax=Penicillium chrysogenum TaxID=5076 RepID=A0ABQ8WD87_PENCH|nr:hypothetical protein N7505_008175 [Penicillium chrysogenum]
MSSKFAKERRRKAVSHISVQDLPHDTSNDGHGSSTPMDFIPSQRKNNGGVTVTKNTGPLWLTLGGARSNSNGAQRRRRGLAKPPRARGLPGPNRRAHDPPRAATLQERARQDSRAAQLAERGLPVNTPSGPSRRGIVTSRQAPFAANRTPPPANKNQARMSPRVKEEPPRVKEEPSSPPQRPEAAVVPPEKSPENLKKFEK